MRKPLITLAFALAFALAAPLAAQPSISPSHLAAAREYLDLIRIQEMAMAGFEVSLEQQIEANPGLQPYRSTMIDWAREVFSSPEAVDAFARAYAESLSEADIRGLVAFMRTPLGQRLAAAQPELARKGAEVGRVLAERHQPALLERLQRVEAGATQP